MRNLTIIIMVLGILLMPVFVGAAYAEKQYKIVDLGALGWSSAADINNSGQVVGYDYWNGVNSFIWENGIYSTLGGIAWL